MDAEGQVFSRFDITPRQHTRFLPMMMDAVLAQSGLSKGEISHVAYASGPGAFAGVRIAAASAQGLSIGLGIPLIGISTLAVLAQHACDRHACDRVQVALDARMGEAYTALYQRDAETSLVRLFGEEHLIRLQELFPLADMLNVGSGFKARGELGLTGNSEDANFDESLLPHASALVKLARYRVLQGAVKTADHAEINYIRNHVADKPASRSL